MMRSNVQRKASGITHARCANFRHRENRNRANLKLRCAGAVITGTLPADKLVMRK